MLLDKSPEGAFTTSLNITTVTRSLPIGGKTLFRVLATVRAATRHGSGGYRVCF